MEAELFHIIDLEPIESTYFSSSVEKISQWVERTKYFILQNNSVHKVYKNRKETGQFFM